MSLAEISMFYILGEDAHHRSFAQAWLRANGVHHRKIVPISPSAGKGGGWSFVLQKCKETIEDASFRNRNKAKTRLIIVMDADNFEVDERIEQIAEQIPSTDRATIPDIACFVIPKRHIETWVHALINDNAPVDEQTDYKEKATLDVKSAARLLAQAASAPTHPPSLIHGYEELRRLKST